MTYIETVSNCHLSTLGSFFTCIIINKILYMGNKSLGNYENPFYIQYIKTGNSAASIIYCVNQ